MCGLEAEARALGDLRRDARVEVGISAARPDRASALAEQMVANGVEALISWGICGALDPGLASGALIVPGTVVDSDGTRMELAALRAPGSGSGMVLAGSDVIVPTPDAKRALRDRTGAGTVDMETHRVARAARQGGVPCLVIRAVSDPADRALPPGTENALDSQGRPRVLPVLAGLIRRPGRLGALLNAKRDLDWAIGTLGLLGVELLRGIVDSRD